MDGVKLRTENDEWSHVTTLDDPIFSDILAPYIEFDEEVKEVVLSGSVAELIQREWAWWASAAREIEAGLHRRCSSVTLGQYNRSKKCFTTMLNLPREWRLFVELDRDEIEWDERIDHYLSVGEMISDVQFSDDSLSAIMHNLIEALPDEFVRLLNGMWWEAAAKSYNGAKGCPLLFIDWRLLLAYIGDTQEPDELTLDGLESDKFASDKLAWAINSVKLLLGRGDLFSNHYIERRVYCLLSGERELDENDFALHRVMMSNIKEGGSVRLGDVGMSALIGYAQLQPVAPPTIIHHRILSSFPSVNKNNMSAIVARFRDTLDRESLVQLELLLSQFIKQHKASYLVAPKYKDESVEMVELFRFQLSESLEKD